MQYLAIVYWKKTRGPCIRMNLEDVGPVRLKKMLGRRPGEKKANCRHRNENLRCHWAFERKTVPTDWKECWGPFRKDCNAIACTYDI